LDALSLMVKDRSDAANRLVRTASTTADKRNMLELLQRQSREGIVFKRADAIFTPGRPASGGDQRKYKFTASASCIVCGVNAGKRSVKLELIDGKARISVGNVTVPVNQAIPSKGDIIEVRYLYAYPGGALYQPVYLGAREDIAEKACMVAQLKFKSGETEDA
jgi:bifunctional non-homologous end joining protein LigD